MIRVIKNTMRAFWMLAGLIMLLAWIGFGGWFLLWVVLSAFSAEWSQAIGAWGYGFFVQHFWVKLLFILAVLSFIGAICGETRSRRTKSDSDEERLKEEEEEWQMQVDQSLVAQRNQAAAQCAWERSIGLR